MANFNPVKIVVSAITKMMIGFLIFMLVFNFIAFFSIYNKASSIADTIKNISTDNNYIPATELTYIQKQLDELESIGIVTHVKLIINTQGNDKDIFINNKIQYGGEIICGVEVGLKPFIPLLTYQQFENINDNVGGMDRFVNGGVSGEYADSATLARRKEEMENQAIINIPIIYTQPATQYYPDLS